MKIDLRQGDCLELMKQLPDESVDLVVTSPPYDNLRLYNTGKYKGNDYHAIISELYRIIKPGGVCVWVVSDQTVKGSETLTSFRQAIMFQEQGFNVHDSLIWEKDTSSFPDKIRYNNVFEYMFVFSKGKPKTFNPIKDKPNKYAGTKIHGTYRNQDGSITKRNEKWKEKVVSKYGKRNNVWHIPSEKKNKTGHPAVFPLQLAKDHIISWSNEGDTVLDPFMGSGTTGVACKELNRNFIGMELDEEYFKIAKERINNVKEVEEDEIY